MRRLRVGFELWGRLLPAADRAEAATLARRLKRLARLVGQVRDRDVVLALLDRARPGRGRPGESARFHEFWGRLRDDSRTGRELLRAFIRTERDAGLFREIGATLRRAPRARADTDLARLMADENRSHHEKVRRAHRKASERPSSERLHRLRIRLRQLRHVAEITHSVEPAAAHRIPVSFRRLQDRLGVLHDLDVTLSTLDPDLERSDWAEALKRARQRVRHSARLELDRTAGAVAGSVAPGRARRATTPRWG